MTARTLILLLTLSSACTSLAEEKPDYDPLRVPPGAAEVETRDLTMPDPARNREIPMRIYLPRTEGPAPLIVFSHGLGGSRADNPYLGQHWAQRGYFVVFLQHPGSDSSVWRDARPGETRAAMQSAASIENFILRIQDVQFFLDAAAGDQPWTAQIDSDRIGIAGHSFGAVTGQALGGQQFPGRAFTEPRINAALMLSPSAAVVGTQEDAFGEVAIPWMLITGSHDHAFLSRQTPATRQTIFPALPEGGKYEVVLHGAEHTSYNEQPLPGERLPRNPNHHRAILALSTAFWDTHLQGDDQARIWLQGTGPRRILEADDIWKMK